MDNKYDDMDAQLIQRVEESFKSKDDMGMYKSIFKTDLNIAPWKIKEGSHWLDIVPYRVGNNNPSKLNKLSEGDITYGLELWVHEQVGPTKDNYICLSRCYGLPCPICEDQENMRKSDNYDEEIFKSLYPKRKMIYNIHVLDTEEEMKKGIQIWYCSHFHSERHFAVLAQRRTQGRVSIGSYIPFASIKNGKTIAFEREGTGMNNTQFLGHRFEDRDYVISKEIIESVYILDEIIHKPTYEEVANAYFGNIQKQNDDVDYDINQTPDLNSDIDYDDEKVPFDTDSTNNDCKFGGVFGEDTGMLEGCVECQILKDCEESYNSKNDSVEPEKEIEKSITPKSRTGRSNKTTGPKARG